MFKFRPIRYTVFYGNMKSVRLASSGFLWSPAPPNRQVQLTRGLSATFHRLPLRITTNYHPAMMQRRRQVSIYKIAEAKNPGDLFGTDRIRRSSQPFRWPFFKKTSRRQDRFATKIGRKMTLAPTGDRAYRLTPHFLHIFLLSVCP